MTQQAINSLELYKGGNPKVIEKLLSMQKQSIVDELKEHFGVKDNSELAVRLSKGK